MRVYLAIVSLMGLSILGKPFRRLFRRILEERLPPLPADPSPEEPTARYLLDRRHFSPQKGRVKPKALHPAPADHRTSVFRIEKLSEAQVWKLGEVHVAIPRNRELLARAELKARDITSVGLSLQANEPPPRHANITGWPVAKHEWMSLAQELAARATLKVRPPK